MTDHRTSAPTARRSTASIDGQDAGPAGGYRPAVEVGGSHVTAAAVDLAAGSVVAGSRCRAGLDPAADADTLLAAIADTAGELVDRCRGRLGDRWGLAVPGPFDYATGIARYRGVGKFASLRDVPVGDRLAERLGARPERLRFLNDASAFALGARRLEAPHAERLAAFTLGTGVGSAFLAGDEVVEDGPLVPPEGRADRLTIAGRPLEDTASTRAMTARYAQRTGRHVDGLRELTALAGAGDEIATETVHTAMTALGAALSPWLVGFRPDVVVFGGSITAAWPIVGPPLLAALGVDTVVVVSDGEAAALLGAATHAATADDRAIAAGQPDPQGSPAGTL